MEIGMTESNWLGWNTSEDSEACFSLVWDTEKDWMVSVLM